MWHRNFLFQEDLGLNSHSATKFMLWAGHSSPPDLSHRVAVRTEEEEPDILEEKQDKKCDNDCNTIFLSIFYQGKVAAITGCCMSSCFVKPGEA